MRRTLPLPIAIAAASLAALACSDAPRPLPSEPRADVAAAVTASAARMEDLTVTSLTASPNYPGTSDPVTLTATIANIGTAKAKRFDVLFEFGTGATEVVTVTGGLAAGASTTISTTPRTLSAGTLYPTATADYNNRIRESEEANNSLATILYVIAPGTITFEKDAAGNAICPSGCDLTTQYASLGVTFSFAAALDANGNPIVPNTNASICDGSRIDPPDLVASGNHVVTGPMGYPCGGGSAGVLTMTFSTAPDDVRFFLRQPDGCEWTPVSATGSGGTTPSVTYAQTRTYEYNGSGLTAVERVVEVTNAPGITSIALHIAGCDLYIDDLLLL